MRNKIHANLFLTFVLDCTFWMATDIMQGRELASTGLKVHSHPMLETIPRIHPIKVATTKRKHQTKTNQTKPKHQTKLATIGLKVHFHPMSETIPRIHPIKVWPTMSATALGTRHKTSTDKCISYLLYYRGDSNLLLAGSLAEFEIISLSEWLLDIRFLSDYSIIPWANTSFF